MSTPFTPPMPGDPLHDASQPQAPAVPALSPEQPGEAIVIDAPPPSFASGSGVPARIPHLGHALLFVSLATVTLFASQAILVGLLHPARDPQKVLSSLIQPKLVITSMAFAYLSTLLVSWFVFPLLWLRPFADGIRWNLAAARRNALKLIPIGFVLGWTVQAISSLIPVPKSIPMDDFFRTPSDVWLVTAFGTLLAPVAEEICFRGFLLPAIAIAYDWLSLPRTPAAHQHWKVTTHLTTPSLIFSAILSSIFFVLLHAEQLAQTWAALFVLFCVSLVLTLVRIRTQSVACSALVHATYNLSVFITLFIATGGYRHLERMGR